MQMPTPDTSYCLKAQRKTKDIDCTLTEASLHAIPKLSTISVSSLIFLYLCTLNVQKVLGQIR